MAALLRTPAQAQTPSPTFSLEQVTPPNAPPAAAFGSGSFEQNCAPCHGASGLGDGPTAVSLPYSPTAFADPNAVWSLSPAEMFHTTKFGRIERLMPPWQNQLSDAEIWQTVMYAWSLHTGAAFVAGGQTLYAQNCAACHGDAGAGDGPEAQGDLPDFGDPAYAIARSQEDWLAGWQQAHPEIGEDWSVEEQRQVLEYIRTFSYVPAWESGYRPGPGVIRGTITHGTAGEVVPPGLVVTLDAYAHFTPAESFTTTVDATGRFEFSNLAVAENFSYLASVEYGGVRYSSALAMLTNDVSEAEAAITIYATTDEPTNIRIDRTDWIIDDQPGALLVVQLYFFGSGGDRTFTGAPVDGESISATVGIHLPARAEQVTFEGGALGERFRQVGDLYYDTAPLIPGAGTKQVVVRYLLPYEGTSITFDQRFLYANIQTTLLVAELPQLEVTVTPREAAAWQPVDTQEFQGRTYRIFRSDELAATEVSVELSGLLDANVVDPRNVAGTAATSTATFAPWMAWSVGALSLLMITGGVWWAWRSGRVQLSDRPADLRQEMDELARRIAQLDDRHALGQLNAESWQQQRGQLKTRLFEMARRLEENK
jgi:mono/diheme cytochrome c family protein